MKAQKDVYMRNIWLGPSGTVSPLHYDPYHNILAQVPFLIALPYFSIRHILEQYVTSIYWWLENCLDGFEKGFNPFSSN